MIFEAYAMAPPSGTNPSGGGFLGMMMPLLVVFAIFYFLIIRPQKKRELTHRKFLEGLKKGDEILTQGGMYGRVAGVTDRVVTLEIADQVKIRVDKGSIIGPQPTQTPSKA